MEVCGAHVYVVVGRVVFCVVVGQVGCSRPPVDIELALLDPVLQPVESHVDGLGAFLFNGVCQDTMACGIVGLEWCGWLWMAEFY